MKKIDEEKYPDFPKVLRNNLKLKVLLEKATDTKLLVDVKGVKIEIPYEQIKKANLETDINKMKQNSPDSEAEIEVDEEEDE